MKIIRIDHNDFSLEVECNNIESTYRRAQKKQSSFMDATSYKINEGIIALYNFESRNFQQLSTTKTYPLIFENKEYFIGITFKQKARVHNPFIYSQLRDIADKFYFREELGFLAGTINFGNDLGSSKLVLRYYLNKQLKEVIFEFEVFPTKLDYRKDYSRIIKDINDQYPYLVLDFLKKTYSSFKTGSSPNTDLIWWKVFGQLYKDFTKASQYILRKPNKRIVKYSKFQKADHIKKWSSPMEEKFVQFKSIESKRYVTEYKRLSINTLENKFFKYAVNKTLKRYIRVKMFILARYGSSISTEFKEELRDIQKELEVISNNPFFKTIGNFNGLRQESLVLQKATGYSTIYKCWIMLNSGLSLLAGVQQIELKNIADLYQIWCFLEIKNIIQKLLGKEKQDEVDLAEIHVNDFIFQIEKGIKSKVSFRSRNGDHIDLYHDYSYNTYNNSSVKSFTVNQRPDIVLKITKDDLKDNYAHTYLYDAKYRLGSDLREGAPDLPTDDSINQMHRYRDAIYYVNKDKNRPEKEVLGAYILFPGNGELDKIKNLDFYKSIESVNIGAFPLRPNDYVNKILIEEHLKIILGADTDSILNEVSPQKESNYESPNPYVLIGFVPTEEHAKCFMDSKNPFYYTGSSKPTRFGFKNLKYFAPYIKGKGIRNYYEIKSYDILKRSQIINSPSKSKELDSERLLIWLSNERLIENGDYFKISDGSIGQIPYRYTLLKNLRKLKDNKIEVLKVS